MNLVDYHEKVVKHDSEYCAVLLATRNTSNIRRRAFKTHLQNEHSVGAGPNLIVLVEKIKALQNVAPNKYNNQKVCTAHMTLSISSDVEQELGF